MPLYVRRTPLLILSLFFCAGSAGALSISSDDLPLAAGSVDLPGASVSALGGKFAKKTTAGFSSTGIANGFEGAEIDLAGEAMGFSFDEPQRVSELVLANLFAAGQHDDVENERALIRVIYADGTKAGYSLLLTSGTTATFTGPGAVSNVSPGLFGDGGVWRITDPFGDRAVSSLMLLPIGPITPMDMRNNDYSFYSLATVAVPEPGSLMLVALGMTGLVVAGRKRSAVPSRVEGP